MKCSCGNPLDAKGAKGLCHRCYERQRYKQNPERANKINLKSYLKNKVKAQATQRKWREKNKERIAAANKIYAEKNREKLLAYQKQYRKKNHTVLHEKSVVRKYKVSSEEYQAILKLQKGLCAICGNPPEGKKTKLCVDHNHDSGKVRGLLCSKCNLAIGLFEDDITTLRLALNYLKKK